MKSSDSWSRELTPAREEFALRNGKGSTSSRGLIDRITHALAKVVNSFGAVSHASDYSSLDTASSDFEDIRALNPTRISVGGIPLTYGLRTIQCIATSRRSKFSGTP